MCITVHYINDIPFHPIPLLPGAFGWATGGKFPKMGPASGSFHSWEHVHPQTENLEI